MTDLDPWAPTQKPLRPTPWVSDYVARSAREACEQQLLIPVEDAMLTLTELSQFLPGAALQIFCKRAIQAGYRQTPSYRILRERRQHDALARGDSARQQPAR